MCDLVEHTDYQSYNGYPVKASIANLHSNTIQSVTINNKHPAFTWQINDSGTDVMQTAYQILVSDNALFAFKGTWNSGKINSAQSAANVYAGPALKPGKAYYWKVRVWNNKAATSSYSPVAVFYTSNVMQHYQTPAYPLQVAEVKPVSLKKIGGVYRADFGKDAFGKLKLTLYANKDIDSVIIHLSEMINADGSIDRHPPGTIRYSRYAIKVLKGKHTYQLTIRKDARNTKKEAIKMPDDIGEVTPFRYAEIESYTGMLKPADITQLSVHYFFDDKAAMFRSSNTILNAIWDLCKYSIKATSFTGLFIDGDRERIPYEADTYIGQLSNYAVSKEYTLARNSGEYLVTHPTWPTEWILQSVLIAWHDYLYTGDIRSIKTNYDDLKAKSLVALEDSTGLISTRAGKMTKEVIASVHYNANLKDIVDWPQGSETDNFVFTNYNAVVNAFYYRNLVVLKKLANDLGKKDDAFYFDQKAKAVKLAYQKAFFDPVTKRYVDGVGTKHSSLHANMFALAFGLVDENNKKDVLAFIKSRGMACSVYGAQFLLDAVYDAGEGDYGLSLLTLKNDRSWLNMINVGSTITMEAWDNKYKLNQDWNHVWGAAPANIISRKLMGIEPLTPGWSSFSLKPQIGDLLTASINVPTVKGNIYASYTQRSKGFTAIVYIPANTQAQIYLPIKHKNKYRVMMNGKHAKFTIVGQIAHISNVGSGKHWFEVSY
ncbi:MAG: alpha-L-rhamnosidase [Sphingobacteriaceae bacterium]|nr:MAG: alpha-L-rhamnosidase [Sphingobacteriaceae bacterium]